MKNIKLLLYISLCCFSFLIVTFVGFPECILIEGIRNAMFVEFITGFTTLVFGFIFLLTYKK